MQNTITRIARIDTNDGVLDFLAALDSEAKSMYNIASEFAAQDKLADKRSEGFRLYKRCGDVLSEAFKAACAEMNRGSVHGDHSILLADFEHSGEEL
jgi:hypothetical protein